MQTYDLIGAAVVLVLLIYWLVFRSDPRVPLLVGLALVLGIVALLVIGDSQTADMLGNVFFYVMVLTAGEMIAETYLDRQAKNKGTSRKKHPFFGEVPERLKRR